MRTIVYTHIWVKIEKWCCKLDCHTKMGILSRLICDAIGLIFPSQFKFTFASIVFFRFTFFTLFLWVFLQQKGTHVNNKQWKNRVNFFRTVNNDISFKLFGFESILGPVFRNYSKQNVNVLLMLAWNIEASICHGSFCSKSNQSKWNYFWG